MNYLPNILSIFRLIIAPVFFFTIISENSTIVIIGVVAFILGALSDYLDGLIARKYQAVSSLGKSLDPLADKVLTGSALLAFYYMEIISLWMVLIVLLRDIFTTVLRIIDSSVNLNFKTSESARIKTFLQMFFISGILFIVFIYHANLLEISEQDYKEFLRSDWIDYVMFVIVLFTLYTLFDYIVNVYNYLGRRK